jgi:hypothetical protein
MWDSRREQLERNKILNKNFAQFEKDTREVIASFVQKFFVPMRDAKGWRIRQNFENI